MSNKKLIWDLPLRASHWLLVITLLVLYITSELGTDYMQYHIYAGYLMIGLVTFRIIWGVLGTRHARFVNFLTTPSNIIDYIKNKQSVEPVGHNPLGGLMVLFMLCILLLQAVSGLFVSDDILYAGPYNGVYSTDLDKLMTQIHHIVFDLIIVAIALHIAAIIFYQRVKKQDLIKPMLSGKKEAKSVPDDQAINHSKLVTAFIVAVVVAIFVYWLVVINVPVIEEEYFF